MPKRKCSICGKEIVSGDETVDYKQKKVHKACFEILMRQALKERNTLQKNTQKKKEPVEQKPVKELKDGLSEEEYQEKQKLFDLIRKYENTTKLSAKTYKLIDDLRNKGKKYSYDDIRNAIYWKHELSGDNSVDWTDFAGLIVYFIDDALEWYAANQVVQEKNQEILDSKAQLYSNVIIKKKVPEPAVKEIDIASIGSG